MVWITSYFLSIALLDLRYHTKERWINHNIFIVVQFYPLKLGRYLGWQRGSSSNVRKGRSSWCNKGGYNLGKKEKCIWRNKGFGFRLLLLLARQVCYRLWLNSKAKVKRRTFHDTNQTLIWSRPKLSYDGLLCQTSNLGGVEPPSNQLTKSDQKTVLINFLLNKAKYI